MKKILAIIVAAASLLMVSCGGASKEEYMQRIKEKQELSQSDYRAILKIMVKDAERVKELQAQSEGLDKEAQKPYKEEALRLVEDVFVMGDCLYKAEKDGKLDEKTGAKFREAWGMMRK